MEFGPVQMLVLEFDRDRLKGEIREAEGELEAAQRRPVSSDGR